ncbi:two pore calcium channel protein 1a [Phtheirospermum japonicum]|uniref:Two pore calcium channel protein 1a n=1 Tax=Phtheirospermum japonicum TaxID=374723 RepID=A0A830B1I3_9LAMI|nr:two pore calcium channel protein 1a [Phtheirospermum japonicum]
MDVGLLGGASGSGRRERKKHLFNRRSEAIAHGSPYQKAAALVDLAEDGIGIPEEILDQSTYGSSLHSYLLFIQFDILWTLNYFALVLLNFLERPLWCTEACSDRGYYYLGELPYLNGTESLIYEAVTILILIAYILFPMTYEGCSIFWKSNLNRLKVLLLVVLALDLSVYALYLSPVPYYTLPFRIAPYIRVAFFVLNIRVVVIALYSENIAVLLLVVLALDLSVYALYLSPVPYYTLPFRIAPYIRVAFFVLNISWLAYVIFEDTVQGKTLFTSYGTTLYQMFVLFTTSNNPDVWIPAYKASRWYSLFFVLYVLLGVYFVTNLILAVVYDSFKDQLVKQVAEKDRNRTRILKKAFNLIDNENLGYLNKDQCIRLFEELNKYRTLPKISREDFELIFDELDDSHDVKINLDEFADLSHAIGLRFQKEDSEPIFESCPGFYNSPASETLKEFVRSPKFGYIIAFILIMNFAAVVIETTLDIENNSAQDEWQKAEFVFGWIYVLEMALKVYSYGFLNYWRDGQNRFDFVITWVIVIGETATFLSPRGLNFLSNGEWIRYLLIARMLRLIRLLMHVKQYRAFVATFLTLLPSLMPYLGTIFCVLCIYCSIGVQIFGGMVNAGNPKLIGSDLEENDDGKLASVDAAVPYGRYWDPMNSSKSYKDLTGTAWTYVYFISFYLITVLLLLNLVVAFVLEAFFAEMDLESCECDNGEVKDERGNERRRSLGTKSRSQRVDILLHHMLSAELKTECPTP